MNADEVLSYCPVCAAPIYGPRLAGLDESRYGGQPVPVRHSCDCRAHLLALIDAQARAARGAGPDGGPIGPGDWRVGAGVVP